MSHMTLLKGPERRRRWNDDIREQILAEAFSPGATVAGVARRFQVSTSLIYKWRRASLMPPMGSLKHALLRARTQAQEALAQTALVAAELAVAKAKASEDLAMIAHQKLRIAKLERQIYGPRSERSARLIEQMELQLTEAETAATEDELAAEQAVATTNVVGFTRRRPVERNTFPDNLPATAW